MVTQIPSVSNFDKTRIPVEGSSTFRADASYVWSTIPIVIDTINAAGTAMNSLGTDLKTIQNNVTTIQADVTTVQADVTAKHDTVVAKEALVNPHYAAIDSVSANMTAIDNVNSNITTIENVGTNITAINNVNSNMTAIKNVDTNITAINNVNTNIVVIQNAEQNALIAQSVANYKGDWVANYNTTGYSLADNVTYTDGKNYVSKIDNNLVKPTIGTNTTEWNFIETVGTIELENAIKSATQITQPSILTPTEGATGVTGSLTSSAYVPSSNFYGAHNATDWEISTDSTFATVDISSYNDTANLTSYTFEGFTKLTVYYCRVRYRSDNHTSEWSKQVSFTTANIYVETPTVTVDGESNSVPETPFIYGTAFNVISGTDTHTSSDWYVKDTSGTVVWSSVGDTVNLTKIQVPSGILTVNTTYSFEVRYNGATYTSDIGIKSATTTGSFFIQGLEKAILTSSDGLASDYFGYSISVSSGGSTVVVGAPYADTTNLDQGKAYVFSWNGTTATQKATLTSSDGGSGDYFGYSVSVSSDGSTVVVGAYKADTTNSDQGKAYIFSFNGTTATQKAILTSSDGLASDYFGYSISVSSDGSTIVVGAPYADTTNSNQGKAYVFSFDGTTATQKATLTASDGGSGDYFGTSVSVSSDGSTIVVGADGADTTNSDQGKAYVFSWNGTTATQKAILTASDGGSSDYFGTSVSVSSDGSTVVVGAYRADTTNTDQGKAYIFSWNGTTATQKAILTSSDGLASDYFGYSISVSSGGSTVVVGAYRADTTNSDQGKAYIFSFNGTTATQKATLTSSDGGSGDYFGGSVSVSSDGSTVVVGANGADTTNSNQGKAYIIQ